MFFNLIVLKIDQIVLAIWKVDRTVDICPHGGEVLFRICTYSFPYSSITESWLHHEIILRLDSLETLSINRMCRPFVSREFLEIWQIIQLDTAHVQIDSNMDVQ